MKIDSKQYPILSSFLNKYKCYRCGEEWESIDEAQPDDDCGKCGARHNTPVSSDESDEPVESSILAKILASQGEPSVIIVDRKIEKTNFGDLNLKFKAELRKDGKVLKTETFTDNAEEGEHEGCYKSVQRKVKEWARKNGAKFTGQV